MGSCCRKPQSLQGIKDRNAIDLYLKKTKTGTLEQHFILKEELGAGQFGVVRRAVNKKHPDIVVAVKSVDKLRVSESADLVSELEILKKLDHPNLIKYYDYFESKRYLHLVSEYCSGGTLTAKAPSSEVCVVGYMRQILRAVNHLHEEGVCHRDIKLDNFLLQDSQPESIIKLTDFGLSTQFTKTEPNMDDLVGTAYYTAPEVIQGTYGPKCDVWSCGVVMFTLLTGYFPFPGQTTEQIHKRILAGKIKHPPRFHVQVSPQARTLLNGLLEANPDARISAAAALRHPWIACASKTVRRVDTEMVQTITRHRLSSKMKGFVMRLIVKYLGPTELKELQEAFYELDTSNTGYLSLAEIQSALVARGVPRESAQEVFDELDFDNNGQVNYSEFLVATLPSSVITDEKILRWAFSLFDADNSGFISRDNLEDALQNLGKATTPEIVDEIIAEVDLKHDGRINFEEFKTLMDKL